MSDNSQQGLGFQSQLLRCSTVMLLKDMSVFLFDYAHWYDWYERWMKLIVPVWRDQEGIGEQWVLERRGKVLDFL